MKIVICAIVLSVWIASSVSAGEDVTLYDSVGKVLQPAQIHMVDVKKTCGDCHDLAEKSATVHINKGAGASVARCLTCHLSDKPEAFTPSGTIKKVLARPDDVSCRSCHHQPPKSYGAHSRMACYDCHQSAGHRTSRAASCVGCHSGKSRVPKQIHRGFTALHLKRIPCERCHAGASDNKHSVTHEIKVAAQALGEKDCQDCHSRTSNFLNTNQSTRTRLDVISGDIRERMIKPLSPWLFLTVFGLSICHYLVFGPHRVKTVRGEPSIIRFTILERLVHWLTTISFTFLALTGTAFMLHLETPDGVWRAAHGQVGAVFTLSLVAMLAVWSKNARFTACDMRWLRGLGGYFWLRGSCPAEKFNAGQKLFFWLVVFCAGTIICVTGGMLVDGKGSAASWVFTMHDVAAVIMIPALISHLYLSVFANPGSIRGILTGNVTSSWAQHHHPNWFLHNQADSEPTTHTDRTLF